MWALSRFGSAYAVWIMQWARVVVEVQQADAAVEMQEASECNAVGTIPYSRADTAASTCSASSDG